MASLAQVRTAVASTLAAGLSGTAVYATMPAAPVLPCVAVMPATSDFNVAMGRGTDTWLLDLIVLVPSADALVGQELLDPYVTGAGASSIRAIIFAARGLGRSDCDAHVSGLVSYGGSMEAVGVRHIGATLRLVVHTTGTA